MAEPRLIVKPLRPASHPTKITNGRAVPEGIEPYFFSDHDARHSRDSLIASKAMHFHPNRFRFVREIKATASSWFDDNCASRAAALSFYTAFSIAPILVIAVAIASFVFQRDTVLESVLEETRGFVGAEGADLIARLLLAARDEKNRGLAALVAGVTLLIGATTAFAELKDSLDAIWRVPKSRISGLRALLRARVLSFGLVLSIGFLLLVSLLVNAAMASFSSAFAHAFGLGVTRLVQVGSVALSLAGVAVLFALIFKMLPAVGPTWRIAWKGALVTTVLFLLGRAGIGLYLGNAATTSSFGAAGSLAVLLLWVYYSALIFFFGAEYTRVASGACEATEPPAPRGNHPEPTARGAAVT